MFKKILMATLLILSCNYFCGAMKHGATPSEECTVTMPDATTLMSRFSDFGLEHFVEKTDAIHRLAGQTLVAGGIEMAKQLMFYDYSQALKGNPPFMLRMLLAQAEMSFDAIIDGILQDHPAVKEQLSLFRAEIQKRQ